MLRALTTTLKPFWYATMHDSSKNETFEKFIMSLIYFDPIRLRLSMLSAMPGIAESIV